MIAEVIRSDITRVEFIKIAEYYKISLDDANNIFDDIYCTVTEPSREIKDLKISHCDNCTMAYMNHRLKLIDGVLVCQDCTCDAKQHISDIRKLNPNYVDAEGHIKDKLDQAKALVKYWGEY